ncbi:preprotein translocase subunit YajC [Aliifodinibius sp. S!AR15-10]|uniref:preprotein translocase subunit YajC n=1 Tax=Aliifodinibius sp. S!AR15-10 TaxID=2950437 RepID=UPI002866A4CE|nr:preprotein translocase subunit YajC [Aliifodinibius sp. S!AR15-10]MDR8390671.1 preprotein translocase subunit YajC [Aliifodinibius sp. S!AR15-10]
MHSLLLFLWTGSSADAGWMNLVFIGLIFAVFYFFIIRPQQQKQKEIQEKVSNLEKGDKIVTSGGIIAKVTSVEDDSVLAEVDTDVKVRFTKNSITDVNPNKND